MSFSLGLAFVFVDTEYLKDGCPNLTLNKTFGGKTR